MTCDSFAWIGFVTVSSDTRAYLYSYRQVLSTLYPVHGLRSDPEPLLPLGK